MRKVFSLLVASMFLVTNLAGQSSLEIMVPKGHNSKITNVFFANDDKEIVSVSYDGVKVWDLKRGGKLKRDFSINSLKNTESAMYDEDSDLLFTTGADSSITIYDIKNYEIIQKVRPANLFPYKLAASSDKRYLWFIGFKKEDGVNISYVNLYDYKKNRIISQYSIGEGISGNFTIDEKYRFIMTNCAGRNQVYNMDTNKLYDVKDKSERNPNYFKSLITNSPETIIRESTVDLTIMKPNEWPTGEYSVEYPPITAKNSEYTDLLQITSKKIIATGGSFQENIGFVQLFDVDDISRFIGQTKSKDYYFSEYLSAANISKNRKYVAVAGKNIYILKNEEFDGKVLSKISTPNSEIYDFDFIHDSQSLLISSNSGDNGFKINDYYDDKTNSLYWKDHRIVREGKPNLVLFSLKDFNKRILNYEIDTNYAITNLKFIKSRNEILASTDNGDIYSLDLNNESLIRTYKTDRFPVNALGVNPQESEFLAAFDNLKVKKFNFRSSYPVDSVKSPTYIYSVLSNLANIGTWVLTNHELNFMDNKLTNYNVIDRQGNKPSRNDFYKGDKKNVELNGIELIEKELGIGSRSNPFSIFDSEESSLALNKILDRNPMKGKRIYVSLFLNEGIYFGGEDNVLFKYDTKLNKLIQAKLPNSSKRSILSIDYSPDKKIVAIGTGDYYKHLLVDDISRKTFSKKSNIYLFETDDLKYLGNITTSSGTIVKLKFLDNSTLASLGKGENEINFWDIKTNKLKWKYVNFDNNLWMAISNDKYFYTNSRYLTDIQYKVKEKFYSFDQFDLFFNRPDILLEKIGYSSPDVIQKYHMAYEKRVEKMGFKVENLKIDYEQPVISIINENFPISVQEGQIKVKIEANDPKYKLDRLNLYINDVPVYGTNGQNLKNKNTSKISQEVNVVLSYGKNKIEFSVHNEIGIESKRESFEIISEKPNLKPSLYVITLGVSEYKDKSKNLRYSAKDADDVASFLSMDYTLYEKIDTIKLKNQDVLKDEILRIRQILMKSKVDDKVVLYISGHGVLDVKLKEWYYGTQDIDFQHPSDKGISYNQLEYLLDGIPARNKLFLLDACNSGELDADLNNKAANTKPLEPRVYISGKGEPSSTSSAKNNSLEAMKAIFTDTRRFSGANVISASSGDKVAFEDEKYKNGYFTYAFLEGLKTRKADKNNDRKITVSEIRDYIYERVVDISNGVQSPTNRQENLSNDFVIWSY